MRCPRTALNTFLHAVHSDARALSQHAPHWAVWTFGGCAHVVHALSAGHVVISDMWCEAGGGIWKSDDQFSFFGAPFIWGVLHNFGGNVGMWGSVETLNTAPFEAFANASSIAGVGMFPEGIDQNSPYYTMLFDVGWETSPFNLQQWWASYALQRYGVADANATQAWQTLGTTVYGAKQNAVSMYVVVRWQPRACVYATLITRTVDGADARVCACVHECCVYCVYCVLCIVCVRLSQLLLR